MAGNGEGLFICKGDEGCMALLADFLLSYLFLALPAVLPYFRPTDEAPFLNWKAAFPRSGPNGPKGQKVGNNFDFFDG